MNVTIHGLIEAHVQSVLDKLADGAPESDNQVDPAALRCVLHRQVQVFVRSGYEPGELTLLPEGEDWWCAQIVPISVLDWEPDRSRERHA